jgi:hypothetical protein
LIFFSKVILKHVEVSLCHVNMNIQTPIIVPLKDFLVTNIIFCSPQYYVIDLYNIILFATN